MHVAIATYDICTETIIIIFKWSVIYSQSGIIKMVVQMLLVKTGWFVEL